METMPGTSTSSTLTHPDLQVMVHASPPKPRMVYSIGLWGPIGSFLVHNNDIATLSRAILERVFFRQVGDLFSPPPVPDEVFFLESCRKFTKLISKYLPSTTPISHDEFVNTYKGRKQTIYLKASESLVCRPISKHDSIIRPFVKAEKVNCSLKKDPSPRVIQPRDPRYNVEVGVYIKPIEVLIYKAIAEVFGERVVMKGLNAEQVGMEIKSKWDKYKSPVGIGLDASRFDQHVSKIALKQEHSIYLRCFPNRDERSILKKYLSWQTSVDGRARTLDGTLRYKHEGGRMSGDMNTALGNCLLMSMFVWSFMDSIGITNYSLVNNGDDCVIITEMGNVSRLMDNVAGWFLKMGFTMKVEKPVNFIEGIEFCQAHPVFDGNKYVMVRNFPISIVKDTISLKPLNNSKIYERWCTAIGQCGECLSGGIPIYNSFYKSLIFKNVKPLSRDDFSDMGMFISSAGMDRHFEQPTDEARLSFFLAFGYNPSEQIEIERYYNERIIPRWHKPRPAVSQFLGLHIY